MELIIWSKIYETNFMSIEYNNKGTHSTYNYVLFYIFVRIINGQCLGLFLEQHIQFISLVLFQPTKREKNAER